ncbi:MAG: hypothetical protein QNJ63_30940 [Calothrix sp. MO_192.B10]|nr:hypothetical protein [Calothrix sp. MO_192.B10]
MAITRKRNETGFGLRVGSSWKSFEQFRTEGAKALSSVKHRVIATLLTRTGQYRILEEKDFQELYGIARDVDRLRGGLRVVFVAARAAQKHPDEESLSVLAEAVAMLGNLPELPVRDEFDDLVPEETDWDDEDDEVILDPNSVARPLQLQETAQ